MKGTRGRERFDFVATAAFYTGQIIQLLKRQILWCETRIVSL